MIKIKYFYSVWCESCNRYSNIIDEIISEYPEIDVEKIDTDLSESEVKNYNVKYLPTVVIENNSERVFTQSGNISKVEIVKFLKN